jgi:hypothetical protein
MASVLSAQTVERVRGVVALRELSQPAESGSEWPVVAPVGHLLDEEGRRRRLILEGQTLASYILGRRAPSGVVRRYVRAVVRAGDGRPLGLRGLVTAWRGLLRVMEPLPGRDALWTERMTMALRIAEMTPAAAPRFHRYHRHSFPLAVLCLSGLVALEALLFPIRWALGRLVRRSSTSLPASTAPAHAAQAEESAADRRA